MVVRQERYITGEPKEDIVTIFFQEILRDKGIDIKNPNTFLELQYIEKNDNLVHMLIINDVLKATAIERRDDLNNVECTLCSWL